MIDANKDKINDTIQEISNNKALDKILKNLQKTSLCLEILPNIASLALLGFIAEKIIDAIINKVKGKKLIKQQKKLKTRNKIDP